MGIFDIFYKAPEDCMRVYKKRRHDKLCNFYLRKIPKYCPIEKILWIEADVIDGNFVKSFRINYYDSRHCENVDTKVSFSRYGHDEITKEYFREMLMFLSIALANKKFMFVPRAFDASKTGCLYNRKYAKKTFNIT